MDKYQTWIDKYIACTPLIRGECAEAVQEMVKAFPELTAVAGFVETFDYDEEREHHWCKDSKGVIHDPTESQYTIIVNYREYNEGDDVRLGPCPNCGVSVWGKPESRISDYNFCSDGCSEAFRVHVNRARPV